MYTQLPNTLRRLRNDKALNVGYLGGSITEGAGASDTEKTSWRALTTEYFVRSYPDARICEINAGIGGTGSDYGAFRCGSDILSGDPDLVFVEFAVNDGDSDPGRISRSMEGIVRQILRHDPRTDIIFIYTTNRDLAGKTYDHGTECRSITESAKIALHYGIPEINVGKTLWQSISSSEETWDTMTTDGTHPNDKGYMLYTRQMLAFLAEQLTFDDMPLGKILPSPLNAHPSENGKMLRAADIAGKDWTEKNDTCWGGSRMIMECGKPGAEIRFEFTGSIVGASWIMDADSGIIECVIDDRKPVKVSAFDKYCLQFRRLCYFLLDDIPYGSHTVTMRILPEHDEQSTGTFIRFHAILAG